MPARFPASAYLDFTQTTHAALFDYEGEAWDVIPKIAPYLQSQIRPNNQGELIGQVHLVGDVQIGPGTKIHHGTLILGPAIIGADCFIGPGNYIRPNSIIGDGVIIGNSCELKNCVVFNKVEIPHWNYVGDSVLGYKSHLGAGVVLSNYRLDHGRIPVIDPDNPMRKIETGLEKFGAIIGDHVDIGSNAVISPGSLLGRGSLIYPLAHFCGVLPAQTILKLRQNTAQVPRRGM
jgi:NDP-sugar pyrophosphorylase family protein